MPLNLIFAGNKKPASAQESKDNTAQKNKYSDSKSGSAQGSRQASKPSSEREIGNEIKIVKYLIVIKFNCNKLGSIKYVSEFK